MNQYVYTALVVVAVVAAIAPLLELVYASMRLIRKRQRARLRYFTPSGSSFDVRVNPNDVESIHALLTRIRQQLEESPCEQTKGCPETSVGFGLTGK